MKEEQADKIIEILKDIRMMLWHNCEISDDSARRSLPKLVKRMRESFNEMGIMPPLEIEE